LKAKSAIQVALIINLFQPHSQRDTHTHTRAFPFRTWTFIDCAPVWVRGPARAACVCVWDIHR